MDAVALPLLRRKGEGVTDSRALVAKSRGGQPETAIRRKIRDYLTLTGWFVVYHMQGPLSYRGFPDLTALKDGQTLYIEVKTGKGKLSAYQEQFKADCEAHGGTYIVARGIEDVIERGT